MNKKLILIGFLLQFSTGCRHSNPSSNIQNNSSQNPSQPICSEVNGNKGWSYKLNDGEAKFVAEPLCEEMTAICHGINSRSEGWYSKRDKQMEKLTSVELNITCDSQEGQKLLSLSPKYYCENDAVFEEKGIAISCTSTKGQQLLTMANRFCQKENVWESFYSRIYYQKCNVDQ